MPRSYSFDHFTSGTPDPSKIATTNDSQHPVKSETPLPEQEGLHYGRQHAETVMRAQARQMDRETEEILEETSSEMNEQPPARLSAKDEGEESSAGATESEPPALQETPVATEPPSAEAAQAVEPPSTLEAEKKVVQRPRRRTATKRASTQRKPAKRAAAKREHHTSVARRSEGKQKATGPRKKTATRPAQKPTRGTKSIAGTKAASRTARGGRKPAAKAKTTRGTARRPTKKR